MPGWGGPLLACAAAVLAAVVWRAWTVQRRVSRVLGELAAEQARLKGTLSSMVEGVAVVGLDGKIADLNPSLERLFGIGADAARGRPLAEAFRHEALQSLLLATLAARAPRHVELRLAVPERRVFEVHASPLFEDGRLRGAVLVLHDITRLRLLEEVRKEFVANVSHELRTPLASIKGFAETLRRGGMDDVSNRIEFVETIERQADGLSKIVEDLLELSSLESGSRPLDLETVRLDGLVREVAEGLLPLARAKGVAVETAVDPGLEVQADRARLRQVFQNILDNAIKFNRKDGTVEVRGRRDGPSVVVSVRDTGPGIPEAHLSRLFERFYRADKARSRELGGTGLGLSIVKHIVEAHGGRAWVESVEGAGAVFNFALPVSHPCRS